MADVTDFPEAWNCARPSSYCKDPGLAQLLAKIHTDSPSRGPSKKAVKKDLVPTPSFR